MECRTDTSSLNHPALRRSLITYLGNKRSLLAFLAQGFDRIAERIGPTRVAADPFSGSGVVARLLRLRGAQVTAADREVYARPFGVAMLEVTGAEVERAFRPHGGYQTTLERLNRLTAPSGEEYFARHYAPRATEHADPARERMFYTRENALRIDAVLETLGREFGPTAAILRDILLASLLVEMSVHINTSGVMKGFHYGWGGRGGDALSRILKPIRLEPLPFLDGPRGRFVVGDAAAVLASAPETFDLVYLDPPYNCHQYGANYHLLTSAVLGDRYDPGPVVRGSRAGIRRDHYRSPFCRRGEALDAVERVLAAADARALAVSYNADGIVPATALAELLSDGRRNEVALLSRDYTRFRGGKATQSAVSTSEHLFLSIRGVGQSRTAWDEVRRRIDEIEMRREIRSSYLVPERWRAGGGVARTRDNGGWELGGPDGEVIELSPTLQVERIELGATARDPRRLRSRVRRSGAALDEAAQALLAAGRYDAAIAMLAKLKIRKYAGAFHELGAKLAAEPLSERQRSRLERLRSRVASPGRG